MDLRTALVSVPVPLVLALLYRVVGPLPGQRAHLEVSLDLTLWLLISYFGLNLAPYRAVVINKYRKRRPGSQLMLPLVPPPPTLLPSKVAATTNLEKA